MRKTFRVFGGGDPSVGISELEARITVEDNRNHGADFVEWVKKCIERMYEDEVGLQVLTEQEYEKFCRDELQAFKGDD